ncbi:MAG: glycosyltransferase family 2 protein [Rhodocyclales bacterium]|nr:glycosyltransferase family 2 protein [Rhodocyclales bacterium]
MTTTPLTPLSCYILTHNSERRLAQVLASIQQIADEILIVDSGSTDQTLTIARQFGATILTRNFDNFRDQRIFAEDHCTQPWVLALDSDEVVSEALCQRLQQLKNTHFQTDAGITPDGFSIRRNWFFMGQPVRNFYPVKTPEFIVRLFQRERLSHRGSRIIHEQLQLDGAKIGQINEPLLHYSCDSIDDLYAKIGLYTKLAAEDMHAKGEPSSPLKIYIYPWLIWARWHLLYGGWRDGAPGRILGKYVRDTVYLKYLKLKYLNTGKPETT